jgi:hypothetical protein
VVDIANRITTLFDLDDKGWVKGLKQLRTDVTQADGLVNKLKVGAKGLGDTLKQNAAPAAMAVGSALVAAGAKAVAAFQGAALEAGKFADATGVSVEQASRLIEVAGDVGVEVGSMQGAMQRFNKAVADGRLDEFSDSLVVAKDGSVDAYESFINTATAIGKIQDPTERAQAAQKAFGKSYGEISELMQMDAEDLRAALDDVSDAKVIDEGELRRAREFRSMLDNLKGRLEDVQLTVGERLVPRLVMMGKAIDGIGSALDRIPDGGLLFGMDADAERKALTAIGLYDDTAMAIGEVIDKTTELSDPVAQTGTDLADLDKASTSAANAQRDLSETASATGTAFHGMSKDAWDATSATNDLNSAFRALMGTLDQEEKWDAWAQAVWALGDGAGDTAAETREWKRETAELVMGLEGMPDEQKTKILAQVEQGDVDTVNAILFEWSKGVNVPVRFAGQGSIGFMKNARGTPPGGSPGGLTLVGEEGPEFVDMPKGAHVYTASETRRMMSGGSSIGQSVAATTAEVVHVSIAVDARGAVGLSGPQVEQWVLEAWTKARRNRGKST